MFVEKFDLFLDVGIVIVDKFGGKAEESMSQHWGSFDIPEHFVDRFHGLSEFFIPEVGALMWWAEDIAGTEDEVVEVDVEFFGDF